MKKLTQVGNVYTINNRKSFSPNEIKVKSIELAFKFAWDMTVGKVGEHRSHRSGGTHERNNVEKFANTFQGKLAEYIVHMVLHSKGVKCKNVDDRIEGLGLWDDVDLICNDKKISIKSFPFFGNLLLLEQKDWDNSGIYLPNGSKYNYHVCVRIKPDFKRTLRTKRLLYNSDIDKDYLWELIIKNEWLFDIAGYIDNEKLIEVIRNNFILPKNAELNGHTVMDASNYYIQTGDLIDFNSLDIDLID